MNSLEPRGDRSTRKSQVQSKAPNGIRQEQNPTRRGAGVWFSDWKLPLWAGRWCLVGLQTARQLTFAVMEPKMVTLTVRKRSQLIFSALRVTSFAQTVSILLPDEVQWSMTISKHFSSKKIYLGSMPLPFHYPLKGLSVLFCNGGEGKRLPGGILQK